MSQMDDLRARIERALEEVDRLSGSLNEIDALKSALGDANARLSDNADQIGELARAMESFRGAVERATNVLASVAEELSSADAVQIGRAIETSETNLKESITSNASTLMDQVEKENAETLGRLTSGLDRLDGSHHELMEQVKLATMRVSDLIEGQTRNSAADAVQIGKAISTSEANLKEAIEAKATGLEDRLHKELSDVISRLKSGLLQLDNGQERLLKEVTLSTAKIAGLLEALSQLVVDKHSETQARIGDNSRQLEEMYAGLREVARQSARSKTKWMVALLGVNVISASAIAALMVLLLG